MSQLSTNDVYQLHIRLAYIEPPIWRRIVVSGQVTMFRLHRMLQVPSNQTVIVKDIGALPLAHAEAFLEAKHSRSFRWANSKSKLRIKIAHALCCHESDESPWEGMFLQIRHNSLHETFP
jgi:hypothetical protein